MRDLAAISGTYAEGVMVIWILCLKNKGEDERDTNRNISSETHPNSFKHP